MNERNLFPETIVVSDKKNAIEYKAMAFISEQTKTTFNYEIKRVRALWDPTLSIPGTGRRGGWRCPVGTRYGGQITDRFGRNCGWGVARRLANAITSIGDRLENRDDERRNRRVERRNARMIARLQQDERGGALERGARNIAERLEGGVAPTQTQRGEGRLQRIFGDDGPLRVGPVRMPRERQDRQPRRQPQQRRPVQREIEQPTTPQNEEQTPAAPERPVRPAPARRRRGQAQTDAVAPEDAPMPNESFDDYTNRKYEEYKSRIEKIQREGGNAGLLTRDEWLKFNEGNLREAYNRVNNVPDAERPAPKPRRRAPRRRRVNASDARAQESANRRPRAEDRPVPEVPQPKPSRRVDETPRPLEIEADPDFGAEPDLGGSLPDVRSVRNVRNRFRERGLPDTAYWRADDYAGDDKAELERRFGRYFDANNQRNARGDFVNNRIQEGDGQPAPRKQPPASPRQPAVTQREQNALPEGWNQGPGTIITHDNGDIIDQQAVTNTWFVIYSPGGVKENFATREEAIAWHKQNVLNRNNVSAPRQPGNSDNAARSEELRRNREAMAQAAIEDARQRADDAENAVNADMSSQAVGRQQQIAELSKLASKLRDEIEAMERNNVRVAIVREQQRRLDALLNRIQFLRDTRTRDSEGRILENIPQGEQVDLREPDSGFERLLDEEEEVAARVGGNSDDAANSERLRRAREFAANRPGRVQDFNSIVGNPLFVGYIADAIRGNGNRLAIVNNSANFPNSPAGKRQVVQAAQQNIATFTRWREDLERAENRGVIGENDFIEVDGEQVKLPAIKVALINNIDAWGEVLEANQDSSTTAPNAPRRPRQPRRQGAARSRRNARSSQTSSEANINAQQPAPQQVPNMNRAQDRHDEVNLPRLANGKFNVVLVGNKGINTDLDAASYTGPLTDIPDKFLGVALRKRSKRIEDLQTHLFGATPTPAQVREYNEFERRLKNARITGGASLRGTDRQKLLQLKRDGFPYIQYEAGSGGANPHFHLYIGDDGSIDGRGYLFKPQDRAFGVASQHAELFGALLAERMGFAVGQGRIVEEQNNVRILQELGPNFAKGHVKNVISFRNGADAITDKESRLGMAIVNAIMGATDRHAKNGMVFEGNGALPIDFGRAFFIQPNTVNSLFTYITGIEYRDIDATPFEGYRKRISELQNAGRTRDEAVTAVRAELKTTLSTWANSMRGAYDDGTVGALTQRFAMPRMQDRGRALQATPVDERASKVLSRIALIESDAFVDKIIDKITAPAVRPRP